MTAVRRVLIANRGEIAVRIARTCAELGIASVAVHSDADAGALHVRCADDVVGLPGISAAETYLDAEAIVAAAVRAGADAVHPGYGFLAEDPRFAGLVEDAGLVFVGPSSAAIGLLGDKVSARGLAVAAGIPVIPGLDGCDAAGVRAFGAAHGWPVVVKATNGGGGRGMRIIRTADDAANAIAAAAAEARAAFGDGSVYAERYLDRPRHIEVQVLADRHGTVVALGDRDCSVQHRHQKLMEEAPAPGLDDRLRTGMADAAVALAREAGYTGAGTVEFLVQDGWFGFLECNTRIQVEHPVTEAVLGIDLVREQLRVAAGETVQEPGAARGHAFEARVNAEGAGTLRGLSVPMRPGVRVDAGYEPGDEVPAHYDALLAKVIVWGPTRPIALHRLREVLDGADVEGVGSNLAALGAAAGHPGLSSGAVSTHWFEQRVLPAIGSGSGPAATRDGVLIGGRRHRIPAPPAAAPVRRRRAGAGATAVAAPTALDGELRSPMHGTVGSLAVAAGDAVVAGQVLVTVEAMKMEHRIVAEADSLVESVRVGVGDVVAAGTSLVRLGHGPSRHPKT